ncbi:MAG: response regulator [Nitrospirae bacterium]|nr:response regulator [Nitrospirota bacterium]
MDDQKAIAATVDVSVLYVEDDDKVREGLLRFLTRRFKTVYTARDGQEGLSIFTVKMPDIVITDIKMPLMDGIEMIKQIKQINPDTPIVVTTAFTEVSYLIQAIELRVDAYIKKPINKDDLFDSISKILKCVTRSKTDDTLLRNNELLRQISAFPVDAIIMADEAGKVYFWNKGAQRLFGYTEEEALEMDIHTLVAPPGRRDKADEGFFGKSGIGAVLGKTTEVVARRKSGTEFPVELSLSTLRYGDKWYALGTARDAAPKRQTQLPLQERHEQLKRMLTATVEAIGLALTGRDPFTANHQCRVARLSEAIVAEMDLSEDVIFRIKIAAMLHDIGKLRVPSEILTKPAGLTEVERALVKTHSMAGYEMLKKIDFTFPLADIILQHHEKHNGSGYPLGLNGRNILVEARVLNVADVVEAMSSPRPYRPSLGLEMALGEIAAQKGILYDPDVVEACLSVFEKDYRF